MDYLKLVLAIGCFLTTGYLIFTSIFHKFKKDFSFTIIEKISLSFGIGCGAISLEMFLISLLGIRFNPFIIMLPWIFLAGFLLYKNRPKTRKLIGGLENRNNKNGQRQKIKFIETILIAFILYCCVHSLLYAINTPFQQWDSWLIWGYKAKIFFIEKEIPLAYFKDTSKSFTRFNYPLLLSLSETFIYLCLNKINEGLVKVIFPFYYIAMLSVFYSILKRELPRLHCLASTSILASVPMVLRYSSVGYADLPLSFYMLVSVAYIYLWLKKNDLPCLYIAAIFAGLAAWTKNEGLLSFVILFSIVIYHVLSSRNIEVHFKERLALILTFALISSIFIAPWLIFKIKMDLKSAYLPNIKLFFNADNIRRLPTIGRYLYKQIFSIQNWAVLYIFLIIFTVRYAKKSFSKPLSYLLIFISLQLVGYVAIYVISPLSLIFHLNTSLSRLILHITPLVVFFLSNQILFNPVTRLPADG